MKPHEVALRIERIAARALALILVLGPIFWFASATPAQDTAEPTILGQPRADFQARRKALMAQLRERVPGGSERGDGAPAPSLVIVRGASSGDREDFEEGRFRQTNGFAYLTGLDVPGAYVVLYPADDRDVLYLPPGAVVDGPLFGFSSRKTISESDSKNLGFSKVTGTDRLLGDVFSAMSDPMGGRGRGGRCAVYTFDPNPRANDTAPNAKFVRYLREGAPATDFRDLAPLTAELRLVKTQAEIALLQRAIDITGQAQRDVARALHPGLFEYQLEAKLMQAFLDGGAFRPGFASIVGSGPNACIPHYFANNRKIEDGDMVVVDIGAEYQYYTADITRTYPANGKFSDRQRELYQAVLDCQTHCAERFAPGKTRLSEMTSWAHEYFRKSPLRAKDRSGNEQTLDRFFIHGLGHYLGMDVHDVGDWSKPMTAGMVFTIEPGLYIPYENIGIRIEDDYLVTEAGLIKMSEKIPYAIDDIEKRMAEGRAARNEQTADAASGR